MKEPAASVEAHYARHTTYEVVLERLRQKGVNLGQLRPEDLYPYDQNHAGGIEATRELARLAAISPGSLIVDVGCGLGGAARFLRTELSCRVLAVELTWARLLLASRFNRLTAIAEGIHLISALAEALPLPSGCADYVWSQHLIMNLPDPRVFLQECSRILQPAGQYVCHEWVRATPGVLAYPLPWAPIPSLNHIPHVERFLNLLREQHFEPQAVEVTDSMRDALRRDIQALTRVGGAAERITALENLLHSATGGVLRCLMIAARKL